MTCFCGYPDLPGSCPGPRLCPMHGEGEPSGFERCVDCGEEGECMPGCPSRLPDDNDSRSVQVWEAGELEAYLHRARESAYNPPTIIFDFTKPERPSARTLPVDRIHIDGIREAYGNANSADCSEGDGL